LTKSKAQQPNSRSRAKQFREEPWRARSRANLPKRIGETLERGRDLVKAAKGLS